MKGGGGGSSSSLNTLPAKRRWRGLVVIAVLGLVFLSMLVPLVFLLGLHNRKGFHSATAYAIEQQTSASDFKRNSVKELENKIIGFPVLTDVPKPYRKANGTRIGGMVAVTEYMKGVTDESEKSCEVKFGSYCLWRQEHKERMKEHLVKKLKD